ncbi:hypothetical protein [Nocardia flavorosea]|uniref:hypothetical protein n=2 Tax=Nocardia TaxID=1817 RepID=UPI002453DF06|nr:hypothetical protein [Nocardia flavorosea]
MNAPAPGPVFSAIAVLSGAVDLRAYPRRTLALSSSPRVEVRKVVKNNMSTLFDPVVELLDGIELLKSQGWELVSVVERSVDSPNARECCLVAFMHRT